MVQANIASTRTDSTSRFVLLPTTARCGRSFSTAAHGFRLVKSSPNPRAKSRPHPKHVHLDARSPRRAKGAGRRFVVHLPQASRTVNTFLISGMERQARTSSGEHRFPVSHIRVRSFGEIASSSTVQ